MHLNYCRHFEIFRFDLLFQGFSINDIRTLIAICKRGLREDFNVLKQVVRVIDHLVELKEHSVILCAVIIERLVCLLKNDILSVVHQIECIFQSEVHAAVTLINILH